MNFWIANIIFFLVGIYAKALTGNIHGQMTNISSSDIRMPLLHVSTGLTRISYFFAFVILLNIIIAHKTKAIPFKKSWPSLLMMLLLLFYASIPI